MRLRNKKTGEVFNFTIKYNQENMESYLLLKTGSGGWEDGLGYATLAELNEEWEDYKPAEPLIKDEKVRKAVRAWAEMHNIKKVFYCEYSWKNNIAWLEDAENDESMVKGESLIIDIPIIGAKNREYYTIAELCGEED